MKCLIMMWSVEDLPVGMSLDELKSRGKEPSEIDEERRERLVGINQRGF